MSLPDISTLNEAADYLRISERKLMGLVRAHRIGHVKTGRDYTFPRAALEQYIAENTVATVTPNAFGLTDRSAARLTQSSG